QVWDLRTGRLLNTLAHFIDLEAIALSPDGTRLACAVGGNTLMVWDIESRKRVQTRKDPEASVQSLVYSRAGKQLILGCVDGKVKVWDPHGDKVVLTRDSGPGAVHSLAVTPDGRCIVSGSRGGVFEVWDSSTGQGLFTLGATGEGQGVAV